MTTEIKDIFDKINLDFGDKALKAKALLDKAVEEHEYLKTPRTIRCIIYLSNGEIEKLLKNIDVAIFDPRDVMSRAEYNKLDFETGKRMRDFNKTFDNAELGFKD